MTGPSALPSFGCELATAWGLAAKGWHRPPRREERVVAEYDIAFAQKLAEVAAAVAEDGLSTAEARRTVLYLSLLSAEISLKAMLEQAGKPAGDIEALGHRLADLMGELDHCEVEADIVPNRRRHVSASRLRSLVVKWAGAEATVGQIIDAELTGASKYPNRVRYGELLKHYPAAVVARMAMDVANFAVHHLQDIRLKGRPRRKKTARVTVDPRVMGGKPCIRGLRVTVGMVVGLVASGRTNAEILELYPYLEEPDIAAALSYASWRTEEIEVPLAPA